MTEVKVSPDGESTHEVSLSNGVETWGLKLEGGARGVQELSQTPTSIIFGGGGTKFGDWEPGFSHLEYRTLYGGRGLDDFSLDPTKFLDSRNAFTMVDRFAFPAIKWRFAEGIRTVHEHFSDSMDWISLTSNRRYVSSTFTVGGSNMSADNLEFWVRRIGSPATLTAEVWTNSSGDPNAVVLNATKTVTTDDITDWLSELWTFDISAASDLNSSTVHHVVLRADSGDDKNNHWEVGIDTSGSASKRSSDGSSWSGTNFNLNFRVSDTDIDRKWRFFEMDGAWYAVDERADGSNSTLKMNGERGRATSGGNTTLTDTDEGEDTSWTNDQWNGWWIKITAGTGIDQRRLILDTTDAGVITVATWGINPDDTSDYVIYGGAAFQDISLTGDSLTGVVKDAVVFNKFGTLARGGSTVALFIRYDNGDHDGDNAPSSDKTKVDILHVAFDPVDGPVLWAARNNDMTITRMKTFDWAGHGASDIEDPISVGDDTWRMTNVFDLDGQIFVTKEDGLYIIASDRASQFNPGLSLVRDPNNGIAATVHDSFAFFSWAFSLQRLSGRSIVSVGPDKGIGMPDGRSGDIVALGSHPAGLFAALDAGTGTSSLLFYNNERLGWHEIFSAWGAGKRVQNMAWQANFSTRPRLWISVNGDIVYQTWPAGTFNPLEDSGVNFQHECAITLADFDMGVARLPKFFKEMTLVTENLTTGIEAHIEYQLDEDIGGTDWTQIGTIYSSPEGTLQITRGKRRKIRVRIRLLTNVATTAPVLRAAVLEAFARTPIKLQWNMKIRVATVQKTKTKEPDDPPDNLIRWLRAEAGEASILHMRSIWELMDDFHVVIESPSVMRRFVNIIRQKWSGSVILTVREA